MMINPFASIKTAAVTIAVSVLVGIALIQTARIEGFLFWDGLLAENTELRATLVKVEVASKEAERLAWEAKRKIEADNERKADEARQLEKKLRSDYSERVARFVRSQYRRATGQANLPSAGETAERAIGESGPAELPEGYAIVPVADLELSAQAFAKLEALQTWASSLGEQ